MQCSVSVRVFGSMNWTGLRYGQQGCIVAGLISGSRLLDGLCSLLLVVFCLTILCS
jgi:hypothetical protein